MSAQRKKIFLRIVTVLGSVFLTLALIEHVVVQIIHTGQSYGSWYFSSLTYLLDEEVDWKLEPRSYIWGQVNQNNFRGKEMTVARRAGTCRIAVVGGSAAFDLWKRDDQTWSVQLESYLNHNLGQSVEVLNAATPGYSSWQAYRLVKSKVIRWQPDIVLLYELYNDSLTFSHNNRQEIIQGWKLNAHANYVGWPAHPHRSLDILSKVLPTTTDALRMVALRTLIARRNAANAKYWRNPNLNWTLQKAGLNFYEENRRNLARFLRDQGIPLGIVAQASLIREENTPEEMAQIHYLYRGMSHPELWKGYLAAREMDRLVSKEEPNAFLISANEQIPSSLSCFVDEVHLNKEGSTLLAKIIGDELLARKQEWCSPQ